MSKDILLLFGLLKDLNAKLYLDSGVLKLDIQKGKLTEEIGGLIKLHREEIISFLEGNENTYLSIPTIDEDVNYPISDAQRRLWILSQFEEGGLAYNMPTHFKLDKATDLESFKRAIEAVIDRHEILRTVFKEDKNGDVRQWILSAEQLEFSIDFHDYRAEENVEEKVQTYIHEDSIRAFDLEKGPLLRAALLQTEDDRYVFYYNMHHIISDGWSLDILIRDVDAYYEYFVEGTPLTIPELNIQYKDYSAWQLGQLETKDFLGHRDYWLNQFQGELPVLELPTTKKRPLLKTHNGHTLSTYISKEDSVALKSFSEQHGGSLFMGILASMNALFSRYTSQDEYIIGSPIAGREHADLEDQLGFYVNTLALINHVNSEETFAELFEKVRQVTLDAYTHQAYSFDRLVEELDLIRDTSRSAVFDVMVTLQNVGEKVGATGLTDEQIEKITDHGSGISKFDIDFTFQEQGEYLFLVVKFNPDVYDQGVIEQFIVHFKSMLSKLLETPEQSIGNINYLSEQEYNKLAHTFNDTKIEYQRDKTIVKLFEEQVKKAPYGIAVVFEGKRLSYLELNEQSNQLGDYLRSIYEIKPDDLVGIKLERSDNMIAAILGVLKSGGAYVPIDPNYPQERINYMVADSKCKVLIDETELAKFNLEKDNYKKENLSVVANATNLAYVIYTSGSTGQPKGVMVEHIALNNLCHWHIKAYDLTPSSHGTLFSSVGFDASPWELFPYLISGGCLYPLNSEQRLDMDVLVDFINSNEITHSYIPTPVYRSLEEHIDKLQKTLKVLVGGDVLNFSGSKNKVELYNNYGPTENTVVTTFTKVDEFDKGIVPIGQPISNSSVFILSEHGKLQPINVLGEICIAGEGLARGYLNQPELTAEKFVSNPFSEGSKMYKTGDLGRWLEDGSIEFKGRVDDQVKIRGHRIELGEIETNLKSNSSIEEAVVISIEDDQGEKRLVAYVVAKGELNSSELRTELGEKLPEYMIPSLFVQLEEIPLTSNGKVDKKALPSPDRLGMDTGVEFVGPINEVEEKLVEIWEKVLNRDKIGVKDNFFSLGGDSIKSIQVVSRLKHEGYKLKIEHVLRNPSIEELSKLVSQNTRIIDQSEVSGQVEFTPIQHFFFESPLFVAHHHFNQSVLIENEKGIDPIVLEKSIYDLVKHHDALRMVYKNPDGIWEQYNKVMSPNCYSIEFYDLREKENPVVRMGELASALQSSFSLETGPLFKVGHFKLADGDRLALIVHHLVIDGVSWRILFEDLSTLYSQHKKGFKIELPLKTDSYQKWAALQKEYAQSDKQDFEREYWESVCSQEVIELPHDITNLNTERKVDSAKSFTLNETSVEILQTKVHEVYKTEINDVLLTGLGLAIREVLGVEKCALKMEGHGREDIVDDLDISRTIGWFTSIYPFVLDVTDSTDSMRSLVQVKEDLRRIPSKGVGYGILKYLSEVSLPEINPTIVFNYLGDFGSGVGEENDADSEFDYGSEYIGADTDVENKSNELLSVSGMLVSGELSLSIGYSSANYKEETIEELTKSFQNHLVRLITELSEINEHKLTPSDLTYKDLTVQELSIINEDNSLEDVYKLSPLQEGLYYDWLLDTSSQASFVQQSYRISSNDLEVEELKAAYDLLIDRHAVLRTSLTTNYSSIPLQVVRRKVPSSFSFQRFSENINLTSKDAYISEVREKDREKGFDLSGPSQMRLKVLELGGGEYELIWSYHHVILDGWSMSILVNDFVQFLEAVHNNISLDLDKPPLYSKYIQWLDTVNQDSSRKFWKQYLDGFYNKMEIPFQSNEEFEMPFALGQKMKIISGALHKRVIEKCEHLGITHNTFIQGVWGYLLSRYNNTNDAVFGGVVSGRPAELSEVEDIIGLFINTIPIRVKYSNKDKPSDLLKKLLESAILSTPHHYLSLSEIQNQNELRQNLFNNIVVFQNYAVKESIDTDIQNAVGEGRDEIKSESTESYAQSKYTLSLLVVSENHYSAVVFKYDENKFEESKIDGLLDHFLSVIEKFSNHEEELLSEICFLSQEEKKELLYTFNNTKVDYPKDKTILELFEEQVENTPDNIAVVFEGQELTFKEVNEFSNQLSRYLSSNYDINPDDLVGIKLERSEWVIVSILGVLKSNGAYVPIDPEYPEYRVNYMVEDSNCKVLIDDNELEQFRKEQSNYSKENPVSKIAPNNLVYVIYTSGSTGNPKGVLVENQGVVNHVNWFNRDFDVTEKDSTVLITSYAFDGSVTTIWSALLSGAALHVLPKELSKDAEGCLNYIELHKIKFLKLVPSLFSSMVSTRTFDKTTCLSSVRFIKLGGENIILSDLKKCFDKYPEIRFGNHYGATEASIGSVIHHIKKSNFEEFSKNPVVGYPYDNFGIYILNENLQLQPKGVTGDIYIGGDGVTRGYLNKEELTQQKFMENPFVEAQRMYKTGDLGAWTSEGTIVFKGRNDDQVKIRGYRIELGEIEANLQSIPYIQEAVVLAIEEKVGEKSLVAYVAGKEKLNSTDLHDELSKGLPDYMIPSYFVQLEKLPLTSNGKVDKKGLPSPHGLRMSSGVEYLAPRDEIQEQLVDIWSEVLGMEKEQIGVKDDFFVLGGNSIKLIRLKMKYEQRFQRELPINILFLNLRIEEHSTIIQDNNSVKFDEFIELN